MSVAIIGGGLAGLTAADKLAQNGVSVTVYDMGRSPGGRASTRHVKHDGMSLQFDHGCQFWKVSDPALLQHFRGWEQQGCLKPWTARLGSLDAASGTFTDRREAHASAGASRRGFCGIMTPGEVYVGAPGMSAICAALSQHANIDGKWGAKVKRAVKQDSGLWEVTAETGREKQVLTAMHKGLVIADQMNARSESPGYVEMQSHNSSTIMQQLFNMQGSPRFSLMLALSEGVIRAPFDGASIDNSCTIEWIARDSSKPGRERQDGLECWVAVTTEEYAKQLLAEKPLAVDGTYVPQTQNYLSDTAAKIWTAVKGLLTLSEGAEQKPAYMHAQRCRYSMEAGMMYMSLTVGAVS
ncbi:g8955 [Coccomyxa viridis]|uniref:G8955 protein n=1 Tax=Coccomyxa viridis TaxID=1274662 RepID=A0ABP1G5T4_9CHLO